MFWLNSILSFVSTHYKLMVVCYKVINNLTIYFKNMGQKGLWSKLGEKGFGQFIDDKIDLSKIKKVGWALELADGFLASQGAAFLDNSYSDKLPVAFKPTFIKIGKIFEEYTVDKNLVFSDFITSEELAVITDTLVDIPKITDETEAIFFSGVMKALFDIVGKAIHKN